MGGGLAAWRRVDELVRTCALGLLFVQTFDQLMTEIPTVDM